MTKKSNKSDQYALLFQLEWRVKFALKADVAPISNDTFSIHIFHSHRSICSNVKITIAFFSATILYLSIALLSANFLRLVSFLRAHPMQVILFRRIPIAGVHWSADAKEMCLCVDVVINKNSIKMIIYANSSRSTSLLLLFRVDTKSLLAIEHMALICQVHYHTITPASTYKHAH